MTPPKIEDEKKALAILEDIRKTLKEMALEQIKHHEWRCAEAGQREP